MSYPFRAALLDTSVAVKWFILEEDSEKAANLRQAHGRAELLLHAPDILLMELTNALRYSPLVSAAEIPQALRLFSDLDTSIIQFSLDILISSVPLSLEHDLAVTHTSWPWPKLSTSRSSLPTGECSPASPPRTAP